jgi:hypothetical protein
MTARRGFTWDVGGMRSDSWHSPRPCIGTPAATAGGIFVTQVLMTAAAENDVGEFIQYWRGQPEFSSQPSWQFLDRYDAIHEKFVDALAEEQWRRSGLGRGLPVSLAHDRAEEFAEARLTEALGSLKPTWTQDIREQFGTTGPLPAPTASGQRAPVEAAASGCVITAAAFAIAVAAVTSRR